MPDTFSSSNGFGEGVISLTEEEFSSDDVSGSDEVFDEDEDEALDEDVLDEPLNEDDSEFSEDEGAELSFSLSLSVGDCGGT